jgi:hypothetical protein
MKGLGALLLCTCVACQPLDAEALRDPSTCEGCHPDHVSEWASSMHAYASEDPVFVAMNRRGQRDTGGQLGSFCVRCHAPLAVALGATADGANLDELPRELRGVGCIACHQVAAIEQLHNGGLRLQEDGVMRGGLRAPVATAAHGSERSDLVDVDALTSSQTCGACHDVVLPSGLAVETTYREWSGSLFARPGIGVSCADCHMFRRTAPAAIGGPMRVVHDHSLPGIDLAVTPWPGSNEQRAAIDRDLLGALNASLCVQPTGGGVQVDVTLDNAQVGHAFPSGTTHARRLWVELVAETGGVVTQSIGRFAPGAVVHAGDDPDVWVLGSQFRDAQQREVQFAWQAETIASELLAPSVTLDPNQPGYFHARTRSFQLVGQPDTIRLSLHVQPIGLDILDDLIASGDLEPGVRDAMPVHTLTGAARQWRATDGYGCTP